MYIIAIQPDELKKPDGEMESSSDRWIEIARDVGHQLKIVNVFKSDIIDHIKDYSTFLREFSCVAPKAIITTPNKNRDEQSAKASLSVYYQHIREWTAGEFYWI